VTVVWAVAAALAVEVEVAGGLGALAGPVSALVQVAEVQQYAPPAPLWPDKASLTRSR
jgi:hypothetical protein